MNDQEVLAIVRTLLAYERNYLSVERTQLAELRTGLALALITPPAAATYKFIFDSLPKEYYISMVIYVFLAIITLYGILMALNAYFGLKKTRKIKKKIQERELEIAKKSTSVNMLLGDIIFKK